ncbi:MAG TPA: hypothetical protein VI793_10390 [Anaerolineales bacterium]|nr:hypothetical protein [Anaerolineales bacterium]
MICLLFAYHDPESDPPESQLPPSDELEPESHEPESDPPESQLPESEPPESQPLDQSDELESDELSLSHQLPELELESETAPPLPPPEGAEKMALHIMSAPMMNRIAPVRSHQR